MLRFKQAIINQKLMFHTQIKDIHEDNPKQVLGLSNSLCQTQGEVDSKQSLHQLLARHGQHSLTQLIYVHVEQLYCPRSQPPVPFVLLETHLLHLQFHYNNHDLKSYQPVKDFFSLSQRNN